MIKKIKKKGCNYKNKNEIFHTIETKKKSCCKYKDQMDSFFNKPKCIFKPVYLYIIIC